jgi:hypothetical protein
VRELQGLPLILRIAMRHGELVLGATEFKVIAGYLSQENDDDIATRGCSRTDIRGAGLDRTADASKEIELPTGIKADIVELNVAVTVRRDNGFAQPLAYVIPLGSDSGDAVKPDLSQQGAGFAQSSGGDADVMIRGQG